MQTDTLALGLREDLLTHIADCSEHQLDYNMVEPELTVQMAAQHAVAVRLFTFLLERGVVPNSGELARTYANAKYCEFWYDFWELLVAHGADIQKVSVVDNYYFLRKDSEERQRIAERLDALKAEQLRSWALADAVADGRAIAQL